MSCSEIYITETNHEVILRSSTSKRTSNPTANNCSATSQPSNFKSEMICDLSSSVFTYVTKDYKRNGSTSVKVLLFVKLDDEKVFVKASSPGKGMWIDIVMSYDELMKHKYLKAYYELSLKEVGKTSMDSEYGVLGPKDSDAIDAMYIVEDILTKEKVAIKGESYHNLKYYEDLSDEDLNDEDLSDEEKEENVATDAKLAAFNTAYDAKFDESDFDERITIYTALVNNL